MKTLGLFWTRDFTQYVEAYSDSASGNIEESAVIRFVLVSLYETESRDL